MNIEQISDNRFKYKSGNFRMLFKYLNGFP